jgi:GT2 family glycosyltransferase
MDASIIIVNYNTRDLTLTCLESVYRFSQDFHYEVILVDNASTDDSVAVIRENFPQAVIICNETNLGFAGGVSKGILQSQGKFILLLNSDAFIRENVFYKMIHYSRMHPEIGELGCRVVGSDNLHQPTAGRFPNLRLEVGDHLLRPFSFLPNRFRKNCIDSMDYKSPIATDWLAGSCVLLRRAAIEEAGGIDENFFLGDEDIDLGYRLKQAGWLVVYFPETGVVHLGGASRKMNPRSATYFFRGRYQFYRKHYSPGYAWTFRLLLLIAYQSRWLVARVGSLLGWKKMYSERSVYEQYCRGIKQL